MPDIIQLLKDATASKEYAKILYTLLPELFQTADEGKIIELPCKVGDKVYCIDPYKRQIIEDHVANIKIENDYEDGFYGEFSGYGHVSYRKNFSEIGKTVFLSHEAAEVALKERET